jgi:nucleotide-binding universal stress UspA family protein
MDAYVILCTDGSDLALAALRSGLAVLGPGNGRAIVVSVLEAFDTSLVYGASGFAGGVMSAEQFDTNDELRRDEAQKALDDTVTALGLVGVETRLLVGDAAQEICSLAESLPASVIVLGSRGRGGLKRAVLGSVSDHVVRHAPCPVLIVGQEAVADQ